MFRIFKLLAKPQSVPLQILSKLTFPPLCHFTNNFLRHKSLFSNPSFSFCHSTPTKTSNIRFTEDLSLLSDCGPEELASYQQILKKYLESSSDFVDFTQEDSIVLLRIFDRFGTNLIDMQREGDALKYYEEAFAFAEVRKLQDSKELGLIYNGLGHSLYLYERYEEALENFEKGLEIFKKVGLDQESVYPFLQNFYFQGIIRFSQDNLEEAEENFLAVLDGTEKMPEDDFIVDLQTETYIHLAYLYFRINDIERAHEFSLVALDQITKVYGQDDMRKVDLLEELADSLKSQGSFDQALSYAKELNRLLTSVYQASEDQVLQNLMRIAQIYRAKKDNISASTYFQQALDVLEKSPMALPDAENIYLTAAFFYFDTGKVPEATELFHKGLKLIRNKFGETSFETAAVLASWAMTLETRENTKKDAYETYQKSLKIFEELGDQWIFNVIHNATRLADLSRSVGRSEKCVEYGQKALKLINESGDNFDFKEDIHRLLGSQLLSEGKEAEGLEHLREAVRLCEESDNKSGKLQFNYYLLADAYFKKKDFVKAEETAKNALKLCVLKFGTENPDTQESLSLLLNILDAQKKTSKIAKLRETFGMK